MVPIPFINRALAGSLVIEIVHDRLMVATKNDTVNVLYYPLEVTKSSRVFIRQNEISNCEKSVLFYFKNRIIN